MDSLASASSCSAVPCNVRSTHVTTQSQSIDTESASNRRTSQWKGGVQVLRQPRVLSRTECAEALPLTCIKSVLRRAECAGPCSRTARALSQHVLVDMLESRAEAPSTETPSPLRRQSSRALCYPSACTAQCPLFWGMKHPACQGACSPSLKCRPAPVSILAAATAVIPPGRQPHLHCRAQHRAGFHSQLQHLRQLAVALMLQPLQ